MLPQSYQLIANVFKEFKTDQSSVSFIPLDELTRLQLLIQIAQALATHDPDFNTDQFLNDSGFENYVLTQL